MVDGCGYFSFKYPFCIHTTGWLTSLRLVQSHFADIGGKFV